MTPRPDSASSIDATQQEQHQHHVVKDSASSPEGERKGVLLERTKKSLDKKNNSNPTATARKPTTMGSPSRARAGSKPAPPTNRYRAGTLESKFSLYSDDTHSLTSKYSINSQYHLVSRPTPIWVQARANDPPVQQPILAAPAGSYPVPWLSGVHQSAQSQLQLQQQSDHALHTPASLETDTDGFPFDQRPGHTHQQQQNMLPAPVYPSVAGGRAQSPTTPISVESSSLNRIRTRGSGPASTNALHSRQNSASNMSHSIDVYNRPSRWNPFLQATSRPETYDSVGYIDAHALDRFNAALEEKWIGDRVHDAAMQKLGHKKSHFSMFKSGRGSKSLHRPSHSVHSLTQSEKACNPDIEPSTLSSARYYMSQESRKTWKPRLNKILLNNPLVPLTLRAIIFIFTCIALALACSIFVNSRHSFAQPITQQPSTIMAVVVQSVAIVYLVYITYDEYSGKPIGLREPKAKMRLIMLDLLFIIFSSANLALTFNTLYDVTWTCNSDAIPEDPNPDRFRTPYSSTICTKQRGLASFLFLVLVMWVATFTISIFRLVERVSK